MWPFLLQQPNMSKCFCGTEQKEEALLFPIYCPPPTNHPHARAHARTHYPVVYSYYAHCCKTNRQILRDPGCCQDSCCTQVFRMCKNTPPPQKKDKKNPKKTAPHLSQNSKKTFKTDSLSFLPRTPPRQLKTTTPDPIQDKKTMDHSQTRTRRV